MATDLPLRCRCGRVRGLVANVSPEIGTRVVCYCDDCQAFARFLGVAGVTDSAGGTDIFQLPPSHVTITEGLDDVRCVRLSAKGMFRWYAGCCRTPIGNTLGAAVPFVGLVHSIVDHETHARDVTCGRAIGIQGRFAKGDKPPGVYDRAPASLILRSVRKLAWWWLTGKGKPTPFFDHATGAPRATPQILSPEERAKLG